MEVRSGDAASREPATVAVFEDRRRVITVLAIVDHQQGRDGRWRRCVTMLDTMTPSRARVITRSETTLSNEPAFVRIYDGDKLVGEVTASVERQQDADGKWSSYVALRKVAAA